VTGAGLWLQESDAFRIHVGWADLDPIAVGIIVILTTLICLSTKESSRTNLVLVITKLLGVLFVIVAGASVTRGIPFVPSHFGGLNYSPCTGFDIF
jgi:amino acid transporter